jgi:hypothetical protein
MGSRATLVKTLSIFVLALYVVVTPAWAQQDQGGTPDAPAADEPQAAQQQGSDAAPSGESAGPQGAPTEPARIAPATLTVPAGAVIAVRTNQWLSSDQNHTGDTFSGVLDQPIVAGGWVVARRGQTVMGRVSVAQKANQGNGVSKLGVEITELTLVDGRQSPVSTQMQQVAPSPAPQRDAGRSVATVGTTTVLGTIVGGVVGGGEGAAIGAAVGATAGVAAVMYTRGRPTTMAPETLLSFRVESPLSVSTENSQVAFRPVTQGDYKDQDAYANYPERRGAGRGPGGYPPAYFYGGYGYCGAWGWGCYPGAYWGGGFYGFGPAVVIRRGFRR